MMSVSHRKQQLQGSEMEKITDTEQTKPKIACFRQTTGLKCPISIYSKLGPETEYRLLTPTQKLKDTRFKKPICKKTKSSSDEQYNIKNQKKDRNVISNLVHHLIKYIGSCSTVQQLIRRIIAHHNLNITFEQFYQIFQLDTAKFKAYVTVKNIKHLWFNKDPQKRQYALVVRVLSRKFYCENGFLSIFYSNKFNKASKNVHYKGLRTLVDILLQKDTDQVIFYS